MKPISVTSVINKSGVLTLYLLTDDGKLLKKSEDESSWTEAERLDVITRPTLY